MKTIVGKVYANWCGHCKSLAPEWEKLKHMLPLNKFEIIDIEEKETQKRTNFESNHKPLNVSGYPTIFKYNPANKANKVEYYTGTRLAKQMKTWVLSSASSSFHKTKRGGFRKKKRTTYKKRWSFF